MVHRGYIQCTVDYHRGYIQCTVDYHRGYIQCTVDYHRGYIQCTVDYHRGYIQCTVDYHRGYIQCTVDYHRGYIQCTVDYHCNNNTALSVIMSFTLNMHIWLIMCLSRISKTLQPLASFEQYGLGPDQTQNSLMLDSEGI
ncbi:hypothetical protein KP79_PYT13427 [Mizuhopecten yessoensis]|uniref:Uncharacterized protein n=1 Tax=Mizuhopecten yessoensis TaxID=6573 RepID=A0A210R0L9_MIZYE|nr:hypothetical protein KP79_PYT13427 [Mizuhopecten yessoensis]